MKIDHRRNYVIMLDDETCPIDKSIDIVDANNMFAYDIGFCVADTKGNVYETFSYVVSEIFFGETDLMKSAYYAEKIPKYIEDIENGTRKVARLSTVRKVIIDLMGKYKTNIVVGHNMRFDHCSITQTQRWVTKSKYRYFFPYGTEFWDTLKMANDTIGKTKKYKEFCKTNGYMTKHKTPRPQLKAEVLYKYISGDNEFNESHTGLEDVLIQVAIMEKCFSMHKKMRKLLYEN